jgi:DNA invertase Pin-like site-specific DNA recombinase
MAKISKAQLEKLQKKYKTDDAIGKLFGITRQAVHQLRTKFGIPPVADKHKERDEEILKAYNAGASGTALAKKYDLSISQTYRIINESKGVPAKKPAKKGAKKAEKPAKKTAKKAAKKATKKGK